MFLMLKRIRWCVCLDGDEKENQTVAIVGTSLLLSSLWIAVLLLQLEYFVHRKGLSSWMLACTAFSSGCLRSAPSRSWCNIAFTSKVGFACYNITKLKMEREGPEKMNKTTSRKACRTGFGSLCIKLRHIMSPQKIPKSLYRIPPDCIIFFLFETGALGDLLKNMASIVL